ncbi:Piso0_005664 [Millerozyma farinosa CBS 7064]|uniref:Piso0_005664 protein n=1 Tax=Pichia sorbitophila (strain ATCC MYA-4447 / BCRC 22081 / CBS 7064 / NBRC 10061 / NRRL Y-12695) TaxID=559304 RepID=G8Y2K9_PICSO|nr:Piso0_005664 [Millerozyma farinosa CBS 7064]
MELTANQRTALHLDSISRSVGLNPFCSVYREALEKHAEHKGVVLPDGYVGSTFCPQCGWVVVGGVTSRTRLVAAPGSGAGRVLERRCLRCSSVSKSELADAHRNDEPSADAGQQRAATMSEGQRAKERAKKRKRNTLAGLLDKKERDGGKKSKTLDLMDFMK